MSTAGFVVAWTNGQYGLTNYARRFDAAGNPITDSIPVYVPFDGFIGTTDVAMGEDGAFVVVWDDCSGYPCGFSPRGRRYFSNGTPRGDDFLIHGFGWNSRVASDAVNNFLVTWSGDGVEARSYDIFGQAVSPAFQVNEETAGAGAPRPSLTDDGSFVVAWTSALRVDVKGRKSAVRAASAISLDSGQRRSTSRPRQRSQATASSSPGRRWSSNTAWVNDSGADVLPSPARPRCSSDPLAPTTRSTTTPPLRHDPGGPELRPASTARNATPSPCRAPAVRPVQHWDALLQEALSIGVPKTWSSTSARASRTCRPATSSTTPSRRSSTTA